MDKWQDRQKKNPHMQAVYSVERSYDIRHHITPKIFMHQKMLNFRFSF